VCPLVLETFGGFHPDAARLVETLARKHGARLGADELSAPWNARSFRTLHLQRISVALQLAAAEEILDTILLDRGAATCCNDSPSGSVLTRKNEHRRIEGTR
jgi:hypothetical protein